LLDEQDFRVQVTREQFENLCGDLFERVKNPIEQALNAAAITMDVIDQVILLGAGTRVPKVQEKLTNFVQRELGKSLNTDEAAAMGAVYKAADLSTGFKVKKFLTKDAVIFPILVSYSRLGYDMICVFLLLQYMTHFYYFVPLLFRLTLNVKLKVRMGLKL